MRQSTGKVKTGQLWSKNKDDLSKQLKELKTELGQLRTQKIAGGSASKLTKMCVLSLSLVNNLQAGGETVIIKQLMKFSFYSHDLRKSVAKVLTVINANQRSQLRLFYKNKKYLPLDLRPKQTRAIRRRLSKKDASRVTEKQKKKQTHFPMRKYAVKA